MSLLREVKPRTARTARILKSRAPQPIESRKRILTLHGTRCPDPLRLLLKTIATLTKPHCVQLNKKNENIHPFEEAGSGSLTFLAGKNDCAVVVFASHSKKRPNCVSLLRVFDGACLDVVELLLVTEDTNGGREDDTKNQQLQVGVEMKPMIVFAGSQWDDGSASEQAVLFRQLKSLFLDVFQGEEIASVDVVGLQYVLMIAAGEPANTATNTHGDVNMNGSANGSAANNMSDLSSRPTLHLRWYRVRTLKSDTPKVPRVELDQIGPTFDFRIGRYKLADPNVLKEAMKHGKRPGDAGKVKKNIETDRVGDKLGRIHLGRQDLSELQTRKMKGLKRGREEDEEEDRRRVNGREVANAGSVEVDEEISQSEDELEDGGVDLELDGDEEGDEIFDDEDGSSVGGTGDEINIDEDSDVEADTMPKRQRTG